MDLYNKIKNSIEELRDKYIIEHSLSSYSDINCGYCPQFAEDVLYYYFRGNNDIEMISSDYLMVDENDDMSNTWDIDILKDNKAQLPKGITWNELNNIKMGYHVWLSCNRKHYDAECSEGVENLFDLPIFKRAFKNYIK